MVVRIESYYLGFLPLTSKDLLLQYQLLLVPALFLSFQILQIETLRIILLDLVLRSSCWLPSMRSTQCSLKNLELTPSGPRLASSWMEFKAMWTSLSVTCLVNNLLPLELINLPHLIISKSYEHSPLHKSL